PFESAVIDGLVPYVQQTYAVVAGRAYRAIAGTSLGGYGSYEMGLMHPDLFASMGEVSGILNILLAPAAQPSTSSAPGGVAPPAQLPYRSLPGLVGLLPGSLPQSDLEDFNAATLAFGDPAADQASYRGH